MKNRKNMFVIAIVALILILGVGYAVASATQLTINGDAAAASTTLKVVYNGTNSASTNVTSYTAADDSTAATFSISNMVLDEPEYAQFEIENKESDVAATIKVPTQAQFTNSNSTNFQAQLYYNNALWTADQTLQPGATATIKVVVTLIQTPLSAQENSTTIGVTYDALPVAATP